jgi:hypothetical protein
MKMILKKIFGRMNMVTEIKLLPCPFCGTEAQFRRFGVGDEDILVECTNSYGACCRMSMAYTPEAVVPQQVYPILKAIYEIETQG